MSNYCVGGNTDPILVKAGIYELKIARIDLLSNAFGGYWLGIYQHTGANISGSSLGVNRLRLGSPAASATATEGGNYSGGTTKYIGPAYLNPNASTNPGFAEPSSSTQVQTPLTTTISPGGVLRVTGLPDGGNVFCTVYFQEIRMPGSL